MGCIKALRLALLLLTLCANSLLSFAQDTNFPSLNLSDFSNSIFNKAEKLSSQTDKRSEKALGRYKKVEKRILKKLFKADSIAARNFATVSAQKYDELQNKLAAPAQLSRYIPSLDTITSSLKFLKQSPALGANINDVNKALSSVASLTGRLKRGEDIKQYINEERLYIKEYLDKFGLSRQLKKINKNLFYYSEELFEIKETIKDEKKIEQKMMTALSQTKFFQDFMSKNGMLAGIFSAGNSAGDLGITPAGVLQTRASFNQLIQSQVTAGGPNAQQIIRANIQQGQEQLQQLKNKLNEWGSKGSEDIMPEGFAPNTQKSRKFLQRLEFTTNVQSQRSNTYFPVATDFGLGIGYRLSGAAILGLGASYRAGWGESIQRIRISHQGVGLRSYFDYKFPTKLFGIKKAKGNWWISGGYEQNYRSEIKKIEALKNYSAWQASGLIGISKNISVNSKLFKGTKAQLLWDFLSYRQTPRPNPIVFRVGYNIR